MEVPQDQEQRTRITTTSWRLNPRSAMKTAISILLLCSHTLSPYNSVAGSDVEGQCVGDESVCGAAPMAISVGDNGMMGVPKELLQLMHQLETNRIGVNETLEQRVDELDQQMQLIEEFNATLSIRESDLRQLVAKANMKQLHVLQERLTEWGSAEEVIQDKIKKQQHVIQEKKKERNSESALQQQQALQYQQDMIGVLTKQQWYEMNFVEDHVDNMIQSAQDQWITWVQTLQDEQMELQQGTWQSEFEQALKNHTNDVLDFTQELAQMRFKEEREKIQQLEQASAEAAVQTAKKAAAIKVPTCLTKVCMQSTLAAGRLCMCTPAVG
jgi:hypothetical protein